MVTCISALIISLLSTRLSRINERPLPGWACAILSRYTNAFSRSTTTQVCGGSPLQQSINIAEYDCKPTALTACDITLGHTHISQPPEVCSTLLSSSIPCPPRVPARSHVEDGHVLMFQPLWTHLARLLDRFCFVVFAVVEFVIVLVLGIVAVLS